MDNSVLITKVVTVFDIIPLLEGKKWVTVMNDDWLIHSIPVYYPERFRVVKIETNLFKYDEDCKDIDIFLIVEEIKKDGEKSMEEKIKESRNK